MPIIKLNSENGKKENSTKKNTVSKDLDVKDNYKKNLSVAEFGKRLKNGQLTAEEQRFFEALNDFRSKFKL